MIYKNSSIYKSGSGGANLDIVQYEYEKTNTAYIEQMYLSFSDENGNDIQRIGTRPTFAVPTWIKGNMLFSNQAYTSVFNLEDKIVHKVNLESAGFSALMFSGLLGNGILRMSFVVF